MNPWAGIQDDFARYARLYLILSIALLALNFVDGQYQFIEAWRHFLPNVRALSSFLFQLGFYGWPVAQNVLFSVKFWLILIQLGVVAVMVFWLFTKVLPVALGSILAFRRPWRKVETVSPGALPVKQASPWSLVITMTICLAATFHLVGSAIGQALFRSGDYVTARYFFGYPDMIALALSGLGIAWALLRSRGATSHVGRQMGVTILPNDDPLAQRVQAMAAKLNLPPPMVGTMKVMNAYAIGTKPGDAAVVIGEPLLEMLSPEEVDAIIGHELGHIASNDMRRMLMADSYQAVIGGLMGILMALPARVLARNRSQAQLAQSFYVFGRFAVAGISELLVKRISRSREYVADKTGAMLTSPEAMLSALEKVSGTRHRYTPQENKYGYLMFRSSLRGRLLSTHPSLQQRRDSLLNFADELAPQPEQLAEAAATGLDPRALSLSVKAMAAVSILALGVSLTWMLTAIQNTDQAADTLRSSQRVEAETDRRVEARMADLAAQRRQFEAEQQRWKNEREANSKRELQTGLAELDAKRRQFEADQQRWKAERDATTKRDVDDMTRRLQTLETARAEAQMVLERLEELQRRPTISPQPSYQVAGADPTAPLLGPRPALPPLATPAATQPAPAVAALAPSAPPLPPPAITSCDELAANPTDPQRNIAAGVSFPILLKNASAAIAACEAAVTANPNSLPQKYQLARALYAGNRKDPRAERLFSELTDRNYPAAFDNLAQIYRNRGDLAGAVKIYRRGANIGDPDSMISLGDLIRTGAVEPRVANEGDYLYDLAASLGHKNAAKDVEERRQKGLMVETGAAVLRSILGLSTR